MQDESCGRCIDPAGNSCDQYMRRFAATKYWVQKDEYSRTFLQAIDTCTKYGFMMAEIASPGEQHIFESFAINDGGLAYWIGAMIDGGVLKTPDNLALAWQPPVIYGRPDDGEKAVQVYGNGLWLYSLKTEYSLAVCQYPWNHPCLQESLNAVSVTVKPIGNLHDPNNANCDEPFYQKTQFVRTGPNSRYLMPKDLIHVSNIQAYAACRHLGLEPAVVVNLVDWRLLLAVMESKMLYKKGAYFRFALGAFDVHEEGVFVDLNTNTSVTFQAFNLLQRNDYYDELKNCLRKPLLCSSQEDSEEEVSPREFTFVHSDMEPAKFLKFVDESPKRYYFGSYYSYQKTFSEAKRICAANNMQLLDFIKDDVNESKQIIGLIQKLFEHEGVLSRGWGMSWTSGIFPNGYRAGSKFQFENGVEWDFDENEGHWEWLPEWGGVVVQNPQAERCMLLVGGEERRTPLFVRPVVCNLQNYFICYHDKEIPTKKPKVKTTTTPPSSRATGNETVDKIARCNGEPVKISFASGGLTNEEVKELIRDSQKYNFSMEYANGLNIRDESKWRVDHVKGMGWLTQKICPDELVPREYINLLMNFIMIFYHNAKDEKIPEGISAKIWDKMKVMYAKCGEETESIEMRAVGGLAKFYMGQDGDEYPIYIEEETYDSYEYLDYVMEGIWFIHQLTAAACYKTMNSKSRWVTDYHLAFRNDWMDVLKEWWITPAETNYGLLFGDMELQTAIRQGIQDRMFPRPLTLNDMDDRVGMDLNVKTGKVLEILAE
ncbi:hypothetical protein Ocin01_18901 [Orchesella cincta]|uniref:C-type lectin domain-containing protein n=1 Tax=Orchesella cincta TaxID=48709 RepID=A0A1D2M4E2_ORCCI|nr:hypothetical protein Ocin01_18901 [Orchesella cincta]